VAVVSSLNPPPNDDLAALLAPHSLVLSVEAHYLAGGVGSLVAEVCAERALGCRLVRCGIERAPAGRSGSQEYLHETFGLSRHSLVAQIERLRQIAQPA
jgi:transketolase